MATPVASAAPEDGLRSEPQAVTVTLRDGRARFVATWRFHAERGAIQRSLELPVDAVASDARLQVGAEAQPVTLIPREQGAASVGTLRERAGSTRRAGVMLLETGTQGLEASFLFPGRSAVELAVDVDAPTCFVDDVRYVRIPFAWEDALVDAAVTRPTGADTITARCDPDHRSLGAPSGGRWVGLPTTEASAKRADRVAIRADAMVAGPVQIVRVELALARELANPPADLHTVFVVDNSRSLTAANRADERALIGAYAAEAPGSQLAVVAFDRTARVVESWDTVELAGARARAALARLPLRNGSELGLALDEAARLLAHLPGSRRVVLVTDDLLAARLATPSIAHLARALPPGTILNTVILGGGAQLVRHDAAVVAPVAAGTEGMTFYLGASDGKPLDVRALVRPTSLDHVVIAGAGSLVPNDASCVGRLDARDLAQGASCTTWATGPASIVSVDGLLWNRRWHAEVPANRSDELEVARAALFAFSDPEIVGGALGLARSVNAKWSLQARWGGDGGYRDEGEEGGVEGGVCGCDVSGVIAAPPPPPPPPYVKLPSIETQVRVAIAACPRVTGTLRIETTREEIVDVGAAITGDARARACVDQAIWSAALHVMGPTHQTTVIELRSK